MKKYTIIYLMIYLIVMFYNTFTIMLHPDMYISNLNVGLTIFFIILSVVYVRYLFQEKNTRYFYYWIYAVMFSGMLSYFTETFNVLGSIYGLSGIMYSFFISPIYSVNELFQLQYYNFGLYLSFFFIFMILRKYIIIGEK